MSSLFHHKYAILLIALLMVACAGVPKESNSSSAPASAPAMSSVNAASPLPPGAKVDLPTEVKNRSKARWDVILSGKFEDAYSFLTAASRKGISPAEYGRQLSRLRFRAAEVVSATCEAEACTVTVNIRMGQAMQRVGEVPQEFPIQERWVQVDGTLGLIRR
jgi:hypothetical protein